LAARSINSCRVEAGIEPVVHFASTGNVKLTMTGSSWSTRASSGATVWSGLPTVLTSSNAASARRATKIELVAAVAHTRSHPTDVLAATRKWLIATSSSAVNSCGLGWSAVNVGTASAREMYDAATRRAAATASPSRTTGAGSFWARAKPASDTATNAQMVLPGNSMPES
jgi:hypothetical protein